MLYKIFRIERMGQLLAAPKSAPIEQRLREAVYNNERDVVAALMGDAGLRMGSLPVEVYVELVQKHWDWSTVALFCKNATVDNLVALLSTAVVGGATLRYEELFRWLRDAVEKGATYPSFEALLEQRQLQHLFIVVCHKANDEMFEAFLRNGCFLKSDTRPLRYFVHRELRKNTTSTAKHIRRVLCTHEQQGEAVEALLRQYEGAESSSKFETSRKEVLGALREYTADTISGTSPKLYGSPAYQSAVKAVVHSLKESEHVDDETIKAVASFIPK